MSLHWCSFDLDIISSHWQVLLICFPPGDACDADLDRDGIPNSQDNCVYVFNTGQADADSECMSLHLC